MDATLTVTAVESVGPDAVAVEFETPPGFDAEPGQFVRLSGTVDDEEYSRFYTVSSAEVDETFEVTVGVDEDEGGPFSAHLAALEPGDELEMSGPFGTQYYEGEPRVVVLAGGPGVGPAVGIGERALDEGADVAVVYQDETPIHENRLDALRERGATVIVTGGPIADAVDDVVTDDADEQVLVYGFDAFVAESRQALDAAGANPDEARIESFG